MASIHTEHPGRHEGDANRDPLSGAPGAHPLGTGLGAAGGGAAGAAIGAAVGGPAGAVVGGAIGAVAGGLGGKGVAEQINPTVEDSYWRENYAEREYTDSERPYDYYRPAYRYGWEARAENPESSWEDVEPRLEERWGADDELDLSWDEARPAARDAWRRIDDSHGVGSPQIAGRIDFDAEDSYWREEHRHRPYAGNGYTYDDDYRPAYRYGWETRGRYGAGTSWDEHEHELAAGWESVKDRSRLTWNQAKDAAREAWHRVEERLPGDADHDGR